MAKFTKLSFCPKLIFWHQTSSVTFTMISSVPLIVIENLPAVAVIVRLNLLPGHKKTAVL